MTPTRPIIISRIQVTRVQLAAPEMSAADKEQWFIAFGTV
jgi:hypothetical protein